MVPESHFAECSAKQPENLAAPPKVLKRSHKWWRGDDARTDFGITAQQSRDLEAIFQQTLLERKGMGRV